MKVLIVEDDAGIHSLLVEALGKAGHVCDSAYSGTEALLRLEGGGHDLVLLDLMLLGLDGREVLKKIRERGRIPVIVLTAIDELDQKLELFSLGADDYVTKPFDVKEVVARVEVWLRRASGSTTEEGQRIVHGDLELDCNGCQVYCRGERIERITRQEFAILRLLASHPGRVFSKESIFEYAWQQEYVGETKTLDVHVSNIRKKLKAATGQEYVETVWGIGYKL